MFVLVFEEYQQQSSVDLTPFPLKDVSSVFMNCLLEIKSDSERYLSYIKRWKDLFPLFAN